MPFTMRIIIVALGVLILSGVSAFNIQLTRPSTTKLSASKNIFETFIDSFKGVGTTKLQDSEVDNKATVLAEIDSSINTNKQVLYDASETKSTNPDQVIDSLLALEKLMRDRNKEDPSTSLDTLKSLDGSWRLIFTTGTIDTQKKLGRKVNYFPIKAVQSFDTTSMEIENGIYLGDFELVKFSGEFEWLETRRKLEFDFDNIAVLGLGPFKLKQGGAAEIGSATGLGSDNNKDLVEKGKKPFFNWISADNEIATARGGGGGIALWKRVVES